MNIPFPEFYPRLIDSKWFNPDSPVDEDAELTALEKQHKQMLNSVADPYMKRAPLGKPVPEPMEEEVETDEEEVIEDTEESEETHDEDEVEEVPISVYSPIRPGELDDEIESDNLDDLNISDDLNMSHELNGSDQSSISLLD